MKIMREETFGPVLPIMAFTDEDEAIGLANDSPCGLNASVWTAHGPRARRVAGELAVTVGAVVIALQIEARFDVKDFFSPGSDFVVGLGKFDRHAGKQSGEPALVYVQGPLARPEAVRVLRDFCGELRRLQTDTLAKNAEGSLQLRTGLLEVLDTMGPASRSAVEAATGIKLTQSPRDGSLDSAAALLAVYRHAQTNGLPARGARSALTADHVRAALWVSADGERIATAIGLRISGSHSMTNLAAARAAVEPLVKVLDTRLKRIDSSSRAVFTGQPVARHAALDAILDAFRLSLVVAVLLCLLLASIFMRSLRYALVSIVPILLVVAWLYAFMYLAGYGVNVVTATIGAISIGVDIDFAVHFTMRHCLVNERVPLAFLASVQVPENVLRLELRRPLRWSRL